MASPSDQTDGRRALQALGKLQQLTVGVACTKSSPTLAMPPLPSLQRLHITTCTSRRSWLFPGLGLSGALAHRYAGLQLS